MRQVTSDSSFRNMVPSRPTIQHLYVVQPQFLFQTSVTNKHWPVMRNKLCTSCLTLKILNHSQRLDTLWRSHEMPPVSGTIEHVIG